MDLALLLLEEIAAGPASILVVCELFLMVEHLV